ncbi:8697_t:CDS:2 [Gigaspora margarita]|uniref:8697_t:CDS:1 n=1 Tax=Gigaspora margarita TaxID=4874 RepID=A0ABN7VC79_GIGMA|nr:8697_t:CDS:2 [Gigaspora margarita]
MEEKYEIPGSSFSTSVRYDHCDNFNKKSSTSTKIGDHKAIIDRAKEFMKDFRDPLNLISFKYLVEDLEIEPPTPLLELLVYALLLLSDASLFNVKCHTRNTIPRLELHLRTLVVTLEIVFYSPTILTRETREKLYSDLDNFVDIHYRATEMFNQGVNHSFKAKFNMRDDETQLDEFFRRFKEGILALISAAPRISSVTSGIITLPRIINAFNVKYPITYWYPVWRELLLMHYSLKNLEKDLNHNILRFYNETYLLESLWQYAFNQGYEQQKHDDILTILNDQKAFRALWTRKEPTALPNSLWFGVLDLAQILSYKTVQPVNLALCYYLALESLQKSQCCYIQFKSLELLMSLSYQEPDWFKDIVQEELDKFIELLPVDAGLKIESLIHDVNQKLQLNNEFIKQVDINYNKKSIIKNNTPDKTSNPLLEIIAENFTCKITGQLTGDFLILSCCGNSISHDAISKWKSVSIFENKLFECPFCRTEIKNDSVYNLTQNTMMKGLYKKLEKEGYINNLIEDQQILTNKTYMVEDDLLLKMNKMHIFGIHISSKSPISVLKKVRPKVLHPALNKATKAEQQQDYTTAIVWLTQLLQLYPKSYSILCRRAFASLQLGLYSQALKDLEMAIH